jgi:uncharacterized membrane protein YjjB (DUF3815 family)
MDLLLILHHTLCGGLAAAGFGVLFNISFRVLAWCAASGALALAVRTIALEREYNLPAASFMAAMTVGTIAQLLQPRIKVTSGALAVAGCIPMIPGAIAAQAILGLFAATAQPPASADGTLALALANTLRVIFTVGALGTGLAIPTLLLRIHGRNQPRPR